MADTHLNEESVWSQRQTRRRQSRAKLKALQLMATSGVIRPIHVECRYDTSEDRLIIYSGATQDPDKLRSHSTTSLRGAESRYGGNLPFVQLLRNISDRILHIQRRFLAELYWGPDKV